MHRYKAVESELTGEVFIIKSGLRQDRLGEFSNIKTAQEKCDELNEALK